MGEFGHGKEFGPFSRVSMAEDPKVSFEFLVYMFGFSVGLWMVGGGEGEVVFEESGEFPGKGGGELWSSIRDASIMEAKTREYSREKERGYPGGVYSFVTRKVNYPLTKPMVDHDHYRIKSGGGWKAGDEIHGDLGEGSGGSGR